MLAASCYRVVYGPGAFAQHHIIPRILGNHPIWALSGLHVNVRPNITFLPTEKGRQFNPHSTPHIGKHSSDVREGLEEELDELISKGTEDGYGEDDYRENVYDLLDYYEQNLQDGQIALNKHKTDHAKPLKTFAWVSDRYPSSDVEIEVEEGDVNQVQDQGLRLITILEKSKQL